MNNKNRNVSLIKGTGIYAIGTFGTKLLSFLIVPLYTYYIATEDMGIYDLLLSTIHLLTPIITMQISDAAFRWIIRKEGDTSHYIRTTLQVLAFNCTVAFLLVFLVNYYKKIPYCTYFALLLVVARILGTIQKLLRALKNQKLYVISGILYSVIFLSLNVVQICVLRLGIVSLFQSAIIANFFTIIVIFLFEPRLRVNYFRPVDLAVVKEFYNFSIPLVPNYLNWWVINSSDRFIVAAFLGLSANGILAIAHKFPTVLNTILGLFTTSWQDVSIAEREQNIGEYYTHVFRDYYRLILGFLWFLIPATKIIIYLVMSQAYKSACDYVAFYYLGTVFQSFASFYGVGYLKNKNTRKAFTTSIYGAIINAVVNLAFIRIIGIQAASISTFVGFFVMWLIRERQNRDELGINLKWLELLTLTFSSVIISVLSIHTGFLVNAILSGAGLIAFVSINYKTALKVLKLLIRNKPIK